MKAPSDGPAQRLDGRRAGVRDVASEAGVSLGTVSNVLNNPQRVSPSTRRRVEEAMTRLGFIPSRAAGQLRSRRSSLIGVVVPDVGNPYWASMLRGIESVVEQHGLALVVGSTRQETSRQERLLRGLESQGVDGLIVAPIAVTSDDWESFAAGSFGIVALEQRGPDSTTPWISLDNVTGGAMAIEHLLEMGHRDIAFINGPRTVSWCNERRAGAIGALERAGLDPAHVLREIVVPDLTVEEGRGATDHVLSSAHEISAVMCANDMLALGAVLAARQHGRRIPDDLAVMGYDDVEFAAALAPPLTTVRQPSFEMGTAAARLLLRAEARSAGEHIEFAPELIVRESTTHLGDARPSGTVTA